MQTISVDDAQKQLSELIGALKEGPVLLLREGKPCAALVGLAEHFDPEAFALGRNTRSRELIDEACRRTKESGGIPFSDILRDVEQPPARKPRSRRRS
jgi:antitoxin (DNA-binding transcriptional repressor) of toxin-antitoxin stability system